MRGTCCCEGTSAYPKFIVLVDVLRESVMAELMSSGFRPELGRDLTKLRETVWNEVSDSLSRQSPREGA
jgi:hypothetical protein